MSASSLLELSRSLHRAHDLAQVMQAVREACRANTRYDRTYVYVIAPDRLSLDVVGYLLPDRDLVQQKVAAIALDKDPFLQKVMAIEAPWIIPDMREEPIADQRQVEAFGIRTAVGIPMFVDDAFLGPLVVATFADQGVLEPTPEEIDFFLQVASLVGVVIARLRAETARAELETKMITTQKLEALGRLAGEVAHDFNNLLLSILGNADLAAQVLRGHEAAPFVGEIHDAAIQAASLTRQLLAFSRGQVMTSSILDVGMVVSQSIKLLRRLVPPDIRLQCIVSPKTGVTTGDRSQLEQVVMNLVLNARDAVGESGTITVETQNVRVDEEFIANDANVPPGRYVLLSVSDDGAGMDHATQQRIFEPFFTTKGEGKGTGLGLSVVQGIVSQHDGHIHLYSEIGVGSTFKVYLPISEQRATDIGPQLPEVVHRASGTETILVVDDQEHVLRTVGQVLARGGYRVHMAHRADEAADCLSKFEIDLVLTDIVMPGRGGLVLAEQVATQFPHVPILLMTGYAPGNLRDVAWPHITKPFAPTELLTRVRRLLDERTP